MALLPQIVDIAEVVAMLGKGSDLTAPQLGLLNFRKPLVEAAVRKYLGIGITQATYTHYLPGISPRSILNNRIDGTSILCLPQWPLRSVTSIYEDTLARNNQGSNPFPADTLLTAGEHYYIPYKVAGFERHGWIVREWRPWPAIEGSIKVTYVAGWTAAELRGDVDDPSIDASDIFDATAIAVMEDFQWVEQSQESENGNSAPISEEELGEWRAKYDTSKVSASVQLSDRAKDKLKPYRRIAS
jgi:hypothetical protein